MLAASVTVSPPEADVWAAQTRQGAHRDARDRGIDHLARCRAGAGREPVAPRGAVAHRREPPGLAVGHEPPVVLGPPTLPELACKHSQSRSRSPVVRAGIGDELDLHELKAK